MPERAFIADSVVTYPYGAISVRSRITHHLTSELDVNPPLIAVLGMTGSLTAIPDQDGKSIMYRDDRTCYINSTRRITLRDFANDGVLVTSLASGEYIRYTVYYESGSIYQSVRPLLYDTYYTEKNKPARGWTAVFTAPATPQKLKVIYEAYLDGKREYWVDHIDVVAF